MATKTAPEAQVSETETSDRNVVHPDRISIREGLSIPPITRSSKYDWDVLAEAEPGATSIIVECDSEEEAQSLRPSIYASGKNYYTKREINRYPVVRAMELDGQYVVAAWALEPKGENQDEEGEEE